MFSVTPQMGIDNSGTGKGFKMTFKNGITISVQFGIGNYCENYIHLTKNKMNEVCCEDAEIGIWDKDGIWITRIAYREINNVENCFDDVIGNLNCEQVAQFILWCASHP